MNKTSTSVEQSRKLIELGIPVETADMVWLPDYDQYGIATGYRKYPLPIEEDEVYDFPSNHIPAWSLTKIMEIMPLPDEYISISLSKSHNQGAPYYASFGRMTTDMFDNPLDAAYDALVYLTEKNNSKKQ